MKNAFEHKDIFGRDVAVGDYIAVAIKRDAKAPAKLLFGKVVRMTSATLFLDRTDKLYSSTTERQVRTKEYVKLPMSEEDLALQLLTE